MDRGAWHFTVHGVMTEGLSSSFKITPSRSYSPFRRALSMETEARDGNLKVAVFNRPAHIYYSLLSTSVEMAMATHYSTLAWKIPWTEEPGRLQSMGLRRVGHD